MTELSEIQLGYFCSFFMIIALVAELGTYLASGPHVIGYHAIAVLGIGGAGFCLLKVIYRRSRWGEPA